MCDTETCPTRATTTVQFPESESDVTRSYCDGCMNDLLNAGVKIGGTVDPDE